MDELLSGISGGTSGFLATLIWYPLETLRIRLQQKLLQNNNLKYNSKIIDKVNTSEYIKFESLNSKKQNCNILKNNKILTLIKNKLKLFLNIIEEEGLFSLYNGMFSAIIGSIQSYTVYFFSYKFWKNYIKKCNISKNLIYDTIIASFLGACCTAIITNPIWVLNSRMLQSKLKTEGISNTQMINKIIREEGIFAFFKGLFPSIIMTINPVIQYVIYEYLKKKYLSSNNIFKVGAILWISFISKLITTLITYPMLTIKTLFQSNKKKKNNEIFQILFKLINNNGIFVLYEGISAKLIQTTINNIIAMLAYENIFRFLKTKFNINDIY